MPNLLLRSRAGEIVVINEIITVTFLEIEDEEPKGSDSIETRAFVAATKSIFNRVWPFRF
jgi:hypothetical protein